MFGPLHVAAIATGALLLCALLFAGVWCVAFRKTDPSRGGSFTQQRIVRAGFSSIPPEELFPFPGKGCTVSTDGKLNLRL